MDQIRINGRPINDKIRRRKNTDGLIPEFPASKNTNKMRKNVSMKKLPKGVLDFMRLILATSRSVFFSQDGLGAQVPERGSPHS